MAVLGDGKLGLCVSLVLNAMNINFIHIGKHINKLAISKNAGAKAIMLDDAMQREDFKKGFDVVIEATGSMNGFETSVSLTKPRGTLVLKSTIATDSGLNLSGIVVDEITIVGSRCGQFAPALRLLARKAINVKPLISAVYSIDDAMAAFEANKQKDTLKVLMKF